MNIKNFYNKKRRFSIGKTSLEVKFKEKADTFNLKLLNFRDNKPDCEISHFGYNFYFRTAYGLKGGIYNSFKTLKDSIRKTALKYNLTFEYLKAEIKAGHKYYNSKSVLI
jgi:hypothetical protein